MAGLFPKRFAGWESLGMNKTLIDGLKRCITTMHHEAEPGRHAWSESRYQRLRIYPDAMDW